MNGGYNAGVQRATEGEVKADVKAGKDYVIVPVGRKPEGYFRFRGYQLGRSFSGFTAQPSYADAKAIGEYVIELFNSGNPSGMIWKVLPGICREARLRGPRGPRSNHHRPP